MSYATKEQLIPIAKAYCKRIGAEFICLYGDNTGVFMRTKQGALSCKNLIDLAEELEEQ